MLVRGRGSARKQEHVELERRPSAVQLMSPSRYSNLRTDAVF